MSICSVVWEGIWIIFSNSFPSPSSPLHILSLAVSAYEPGSETRVRLTIVGCRVRSIWRQDVTLTSDPPKSRANYPEAVMKSWQCGQMYTQGESMFGIAVWLIVLCGIGKTSHQSTRSRVSRLSYAITLCSLKRRKISEWKVVQSIPVVEVVLRDPFSHPNQSCEVHFITKSQWKHSFSWVFILQITQFSYSAASRAHTRTHAHSSWVTAASHENNNKTSRCWLQPVKSVCTPVRSQYQ